MNSGTEPKHRSGCGCSQDRTGVTHPPERAGHQRQNDHVLGEMMIDASDAMHACRERGQRDTQREQSCRRHGQAQRTRRQHHECNREENRVGRNIRKKPHRVVRQSQLRAGLQQHAHCVVVTPRPRQKAPLRCVDVWIEFVETRRIPCRIDDSPRVIEGIVADRNEPVRRVRARHPVQLHRECDRGHERPDQEKLECGRQAGTCRPKQHLVTGLFRVTLAW